MAKLLPGNSLTEAVIQTFVHRHLQKHIFLRQTLAPTLAPESVWVALVAVILLNLQVGFWDVWCHILLSHSRQDPDSPYQPPTNPGCSNLRHDFSKPQSQPGWMKVEGDSPNDSQARMVLSRPGFWLLFEGKPKGKPPFWGILDKDHVRISLPLVVRT